MPPRFLLPAARLVERGLERIGSRPGDEPVLEPYLGYATPDALILRGRVLSHLRRAQPVPEQSRWTNLRQMVLLFLTDEVSDVTVKGGGTTAVSDAEGYVTLHVAPDWIEAERSGAERSWADVTVEIAGRAETRKVFPARLPGAEARYMVISDIDDTMIETGAHSLWRNLWTTFTGSALSRKVHDDAVELMRYLTQKGRNPVFYVSSSPWNLHRFLEDLFARADVPSGPMFLRDLGVTGDGVGKSHGNHKGSAIDVILAANPGLSAYLVGDSGQHDATVYLDAVLRHPGRILGVALREPAPGVGNNDARAIAGIEAAGVPCFHGASFQGAVRHWGLD